MIQAFQLHLAGRDISMQMDLDETSSSDAALLYYLRMGQPPEPEVCQVMARVLKEGDCAVDAGANIGFFTVLMSALVGTTGKVIAVEPGANNLPKLLRNIDLNDCANIEVRTLPLWNEITRIPFYSYVDGGANSVFGDRIEAPELMNTITLAELVPSKEACKLLKMDIEGSETRAAKGGLAGALWNFAYIISEINADALARADSSVQELRDVMLKVGKRAFVLSDNGQLPAKVPDATVLTPTRQNANVLFTTAIRIQEAWPEVFV